jgi:hypothetical protein
MIMSYLNRFILALVSALALAGCGGTQQKPGATPAAGTNASVDAIASEALAVFHLQSDGARAWTLISEATKRAPERPDLAYLQTRLCELLEGCQPEPYEARVRKLDADNGVIWMRSLAAAQRRRETAVEAQLVDAIGRSRHVDVYWNALAASIAGARIANRTRPDTALSETISWMGEAIVPSMQPLTIACSRSRTTDQQWADRCRRAARALTNGDTYLIESVGTKLAQQVAGETTEQIQLGERERTSRYLWRTYAALSNSQIERDKYATELIELMRKLRREQDVHLAVTRWAGRPVTPPQGWVDE